MSTYSTEGVSFFLGTNNSGLVGIPVLFPSVALVGTLPHGWSLALMLNNITYRLVSITFFLVLYASVKYLTILLFEMYVSFVKKAN